MNATKNLCSICGIRPIGGGKSGGWEDKDFNKQQGYCNPCGDEGQMQNSHMNGHESIGENDCWLCHPELDETAKPYVRREGTSRAGMVVHVTIDAAALDKAFQTIAQLPEGFEHKLIKPTKRNGLTTKLTFHSLGQTFELRWDDRGRCLGGTITEDGRTRKIRNVAEALRLAA